MKTKTLLIAAVMFLGISVAAFAQATYTVGYVPVPTVVSSGHTEKSGDITFTTIPTTGPTITGTIVITYSSPITFEGSIVEVPPAVPTGTMPTFNIIEPLQGEKVLTITIVPDTADPELLYGFRLTGVRLDVYGEGTPLYASIETTGNAIVVGQNNVTVITDSKQGISSFSVLQPVVYNTLGVLVSGGAPDLVAVEGFRTAFSFAYADDTTQTLNSTQLIKIGITEPIPAGVSITFPATDSSRHWELATDGTGTTAASGAITLTSVSNPRAVYYRIATTTDQIATETFMLNNIGIIVTETAFPTYTPGTLSVYADIAPIQEEVPDFNEERIPRYASDPTPSVVFLTFGSAAKNTTLMIPYATTEVGYDTGIALANTTKDPGLLMGDVRTAFPQTGKIVFYCYNNDGVVTTIDTSNAAVKASLEAQSAYFPLTAAGYLETGKSYAVVLSQLLTAAGADADFHGYIIIVTDFTNAHGQYFLTNWQAFTNGAQMLVLSGTRSTDLPEANDH